MEGGIKKTLDSIELKLDRIKIKLESVDTQSSSKMLPLIIASNFLMLDPQSPFKEVLPNGINQINRSSN